MLRDSSIPRPSSISLKNKDEWISGHIECCNSLYGYIIQLERVRFCWAECHMNQRILRHAVYSAWMELCALESKRNIDVDMHKCLAHLISKCIHFRPIQLSEEGGATGENCAAAKELGKCKPPASKIDYYHPLLCNAFFCAMLALWYMDITNDVDFFHKYLRSQPSAGEDGYLSSLLYHLHFHGVPSPRYFGHELYLLDTCHRHYQLQKIALSND